MNGKFSTWNFALTPITILQGIEMHLSSGAEKVSILKNMFTFLVYELIHSDFKYFL